MNFIKVLWLPEQDEQLPLAPWNKGDNPFKDDHCFDGMQTGYAPEGYWWFSISPASPFSKIMSKVEYLNNSNGFLNKLFRPKIKNEINLYNIVKRTNKTGYMYADIINDLGESAEEIMKNSKLIQMTYAYARRSAATALYLQGLIDEDVYDHNLSFFKAVQAKTDHSVKFQEKSFSDSVTYMQTYNPVITRMLVKQMAIIAKKFENPEDKLIDKELTEIVMKAYAE
jgi:hypothetical protein